MGISGLTGWITSSRSSLYLISFVLATVLISAVGLKNLELSSDYKIFFDKNDKDLLRLEQMQQVYTKTENVFVMVEPPADTVFDKTTLTLIHDMTQKFWKVPFTSRVDSITNYLHSYAEGDDILIEDFIYEPEEIDADRIKFMEKEVLIEKDLLGKLVTVEGQFTAINLTTLLPGKDNKAEVLAVNASVEAIIAKFKQQYPDYRFYTSGITTMNAAFLKAAQRDFVTLVPLMMVFVLVVAGLVLGSASSALTMLAIVLMSFAAALGLAGWFGIKLSAPSISAPIIMFTVIVASSVHIMAYVKRKVCEGYSAQKAVMESYQRNASPIILSHITTIIGFLSMNSSDSPPFRDLGNIVVFGVIFSLILVMTLLPWILARLNHSTVNQLIPGVGKLAGSVADRVIHSRKPILLLMMPLAVGIAMLGLNNNLNDNLIRYFDKSVEFRLHAEAVDQQFSGIYNIDYSLNSGRENGIFEPDYLKFLETFENWLEQQPEVVAVESPLHRIKDLNQLMNGDKASFYRIPKNKATAAQNFLLFEMFLPYGRDTGNFINIDKSSLKLTTRLRNSSSQQMIAFEQRVNEWLEKRQPDFVAIEYSSPAVVFSHIGITSINSLLKGAAMAMLIISVALVFVFRSALIGMVSLIPNILPIAAAFGVWNLLSGEISMGLAGVAAMAIGIVVDDTVHFLFHYIKGIRQGLSPEECVRQTFEKTMSAIFVSSVLLVMGFMLLATSSFEKNSDMGVLTSVTILLALLFDILLLPAIAMTFIHQRKHSSQG